MPAPRPTPPIWVAVAPGVEMRTFTTSDSRVGEPPDTRIVAFRTSPDHVFAAAGAMLDAAGWRRGRSALAAVNGGFFDPSERPVGLLITSGKVVSRLRRGGGGIFLVENAHASILSAAALRMRKGRLRGIQQAVQCGPLLVENGQCNHLKTQSARRTGIGIQQDGHVIIAAAEGELSLPAWAARWASPADLNCVDALNLDGGPSTQLSLAAGAHSLEIPGGWPVPDAVIVK